MKQEKVLVCGMSGRFPESDNVEEFWNNLMTKVDLVTDDDRRGDRAFCGLPKGSGKLKDLTRFDASFFGVLPKQANKMDPQLRIILEVAHEAIIDAGFTPRELRGTNTGVYVGASYSDAEMIWMGDIEAKDGYGILGTFRSFLSNRISYFYDFKGPSYNVDSACSSSLFAIHNAFQDLQSGKCDYALVGGVTLTIRPQTARYLSLSGFLSPDGRSKTFDESADGFTRAEAVVAMLLTRESLCKRAYGEVIYSLTNSDGFTEQGITHPSLEAQVLLLRQAYKECGISVDDVEYVEAHGTGTSPGDLVEGNVLHEVFGQYRSKEAPLLVGSVKSNMGHSEGAGGTVSLVKVLMTMNYGVIPPHLHIKKPRTKVKSFVDGTMKIVTEPTKYEGGPIGVSSFGFGGSNAHVILKPYHGSRQQNVTSALPRVLVSSSRTAEGVEDNLKYLTETVETNGGSVETNGGFYRMACEVADNPIEEMPYRGYRLQMNNDNSKVEIEKVDGGAGRPIWFIFTGMGADWPGMGKDLMALKTFERTISKCHDAIKLTDPDVDLMDIIMNGTKEKLDNTVAKFVCNISTQVALVNCLRDLNIHPEGIIGHSMGETACAYADGLLTEEQTVMAAYWRGRCITDGNLPDGSMASIGLTWEEVKARLPEGVIAACHNAEDNVTISGDEKAVEKFVSELESEGVFARMVNTNKVAYHSSHVQPVAPDLQRALEKVIKHRGLRSTSWISTSYAEELWATERARWMTPSYIVNNLVSPVLFYDAVRKIPSNAIVIEIAPHGLLKALLKRTLHQDCEYISLTNRKEPDNLQYFLSNVGKLFNLGVSLDLSKLYPPVDYPLGIGVPPLSPGVRWEHGEEWDVPAWEEFLLGNSKDRSVTCKEIDATEGGPDMFVKDHNIDGRVLYPATGYIVLAWKTVADMLGSLPENLAINFNDVTIHRATIIPNSGKVKLTVRIAPCLNLFSICENDEVTVSGKYSIPEKPFIPNQEQGLIVNDDSNMLNQEDIYKELRLIGYNYGPSFRGVQRSNVDGSKADLEWNGNWITFLDTMLQVIVFGKPNPSRRLYLPTRILSLRINPLVHTEKVDKGLSNAGEIPVHVDRVLNTCCSGGVEISGLHTTLAPKRQVKEVPTLESVHFVPYGKVNLPPKSDVAEYSAVCKEYLQHFVRKFSSFYTKKVLTDLQENKAEVTNYKAKLSSYLAEDHCGYLKVLNQMVELEGDDNLVKALWNVVDTNVVELAKDKLRSLLLQNHTLKNLLDVVWENSTTRKIKAVELGARYGGLFIHIIPSLLSEPLLELDFTAVDPDVEMLSKAFSDQLKSLNVQTSRFDINEGGVNGLAQSNLVAVRGLAQRSESVPKSLQTIHSMVAEGGFLLLHEITSDFETYLGFDDLIHAQIVHKSYDSKKGFYLTCTEWEEVILSSGFELIQEVSDGYSSTMFLCRKRTNVVTSSKDVFISISGKEYGWVEDVKIALGKLPSQDNPGNIWLIADGDYQCGVVGMVNCLRKEDGGKKIRCIFDASYKSKKSDISPGSTLMNKLMKADLVMNVFKEGVWGSFRHQEIDKDALYTEGETAYVDVLTSGDLTSFRWIKSSMNTNVSLPHHTLCTVYYSSLNFRDVMLASGKLPAGSIPEDLAHQECLIGMEFAGRDQQGKRLMGIVSSKGLATHVLAESHLLFDIPDDWTLEDAATVPVVYCTAYYALVVRGQLKRGESILIHSGSGGVGQAAIAIAVSYGCEIYTTVGTDEKRKFLMKRYPSLTEKSFANSRDVSFEEHLMRQTNGKGVNLVLNSLAGEKLEASLRCLSMHGRFLEIGKYDLSQNKELGMSIFLKNTAFHGIHLDRIFERGNPEWPNVFKLMKKGIHEGVVQPLSRRCFARDEIEDAFRFMAQGKHIGKVLIEVNPEEGVSLSPTKALTMKARTNCRLDRVYIIVGGLGGFGLEVADWLVARGCKNLVLTSRSGLTQGYQRRCVKRWHSHGVLVRISNLDASDENECNQLIKESQKLGPIGGVFNLAMVLRDGLFENLTAEDFRIVCKSKLEVANNLDRVTRQLCGPELDWFVVFSSLTCGRGNAGQANYGFANSAMERTCERRHADKLPGLAIQWGVVGDVGVLAESANQNDTEKIGCVAQSISSCLSSLDMFLSQSLPVMSSFVKANRDQNLAEKNPRTQMVKFVTTFFGIEDVSSVNQDITLAELGLDSLMGVEVKQTIERDFDTVLSMKETRLLTLRNLINAEFGQSKSDTIETKDTKTNIPVVAPLVLVSPIIRSEKDNCLVQLNVGKTENVPIFFIHPIEGTIDVFQPLVTKLADYPLYALQVTTDVPHDTVSNMAAYYLSKMRFVQPDGPYNIAGYSFGTVIAMEIALQLQNDRNAKIGNKLLLIDASPDFLKSLIKIVLEQKYKLDKADVQAVGYRAGMNVQTLTYFIQIFKTISFEKMKRQLIEKKTYEERLDLTVSTIMEVVKDVDKQDMAFSADSFVKRLWAAHDYQPKSKYKGSITLLKAQSSGKDFFYENNANDYNLSKVCSGEVKVHEIEGDHHRIMQDPALQEVAKHMKELF